MQHSKKFGFVLILVSCLAAWFIANAGVDHQKLEMASIANMFGPPLCGAISLTLFAIVDLVFKTARRILVLLLVIANLFVGISIRMESDKIARRAGGEESSSVLFERPGNRTVEEDQKMRFLLGKKLLTNLQTKNN